ncbi:MAG: 1-acyl-sn-glycerol-3-phosphate acyltransferase [Gemmatimonadota bacterium]|nr:1-acyl-sn-glycerol-3-phosphate acyltransferase [Gemmatimonadota bacterium]MDE3171929.1 1-acyl-sn-glycerol-3-phosphate acyltransferase [Gemmatimonadota bacterium]
MTTTLIPPAAPDVERPCYEPMDVGYCRDLLERAIGPLSDHYFRPRIVGAEKLPATGPVIAAANHSGTAFPYDAIVLDFALWRRERLNPEAKWRSVFEKELTLAWWMRPFGVDNLWRRGGGVDMTFDNFERLLERGDRVIYYPEGVPGIGKGFHHRYQLQRFRTSFVRLAARHDVPVYPLYVVNAEWVMPFHATFPPLDRLMQRYFHVPFLPLPAGILALIFPWMWYLALPAQMTFVVGDPLDMRAVLRDAGASSYDDPDRNALDRAAHRVRRIMQSRLDALVAQYGKRPYAWRSLVASLRAARGRRWRALPTGWPVAFIRNERDHFRGPARNRLHAFLRDADLIAFYLPLGWPLLSLLRRIRKPPCGHRGLSAHDSREAQGTFVWRLSERPLPPRGDRARGQATP